MTRILLCDDSSIILKLLTHRFKDMDVEIVGSAQNGADGVDMFMKLQPDLMFLDITMPIKDGKTCLKEILTHSPQAKIIMSSAMSDESTIAECLKMGAIGFIPKKILNDPILFKEAIHSIEASHLKAG